MNIYIIGAGSMGGAIAKALAKKGQRVFVCNKTYATAKALAKGTKIVADKSFENLGKADIVILGVKPQDMSGLAKNVRAKINTRSIIVSIAAAWTNEKLSKLFKHKKIARIMPTLALTVGQGVTVLKFSKSLTQADKNQVKKMLGLFTEYFEINDENLIDVGGVIYGCAKAFYFLLAEALEAASTKFGINPKTSHLLTEKTFLGAALLQKGQKYPDLIERIATKKGVTEATIKALNQKNFKKIIETAVWAGIKRTRQLSHG